MIFSVCSKKFTFVRNALAGIPEISEGCVSIFTSQGFFAALGHNEVDASAPYRYAELYAEGDAPDEPIQAGKVLVSRSTGVYGAFYEDYQPPVLAQMPVASLSDLKADTAAELWMTDGTGVLRVYSGEIVALFPDKQYPVLFEVTDDQFPGASFGSSGSVVVQDGKIAAVVAGANTYPARLLYCTSAEQMMMDLKAMIQELAGSEEDS